MQLTELINSFKQVQELEDKCLSFIGDGAHTIKQVEFMVIGGLETDNLIFGAFNPNQGYWEFACVLQAKAGGEYVISSADDHSGIKDVVTNNIADVIPAVVAVIKYLITESEESE